MTEATFQADSQIAEIAEAYSLDAVDLAARGFHVTLDWTESSIQDVEKILGRMHDEMSGAVPADDAIWKFTKAFGSYLGEVLRRQHGGEWGTISLNGQSFPGVRQSNGGLVWPWSRAYKRLVVGSEENVWHYFTMVVRPTTSHKSEQELPNTPLDREQNSPAKAWC